MRPSLKLLRTLGELCASLLGTLVIAINVPWAEVLSASIPGGGDNPAHPVLMRDVTEAFLQHGSIVHYSYSFWSGFELFQFYFPLPYLCGGLLAAVVHPHVAFKLITLLPILLVPPAFYVMARLMALGVGTAAVASLLAVSFLHTDAHVMWGGNVSSTLAGMIGNTWAFAFFAVCAGALFRVRDSGRFSLLAVCVFAAAALSHFYAALMLFVLGCVFAAEDLLRAALRELCVRKAAATYAVFAAAGALLAWWVLPLMYYTRYSTDFGENWNVSLAQTFTHYEKVFAFLAWLVLAACCVHTGVQQGKSARRPLYAALPLILFCGVQAFNYAAAHLPELLATAPAWLNGLHIPVSGRLTAAVAAYASVYLLILLARARDWTVLRVYLFGALFVICFYANEYLNSTAFLNIRLWPSIYFALYALIILAFARLGALIPRLVTGACACLFYFLVPPAAYFEKAKTWMVWNYSGMESKAGADDYLHIVAILRAQPPGRVSFESADANNGIFGTVRAFELLPFLTPHELVEGGILNSARFPGVGYTLQCLVSNSCAGWPAGSIMPGTDIPRAVEMMRALGVSYHIAVSPDIKQAIEHSGQFNILHRGKFATLYAAREPSRLVEAYDRRPPVIEITWPYTMLLNQPRWDRLRHTALAFASNLAPAPPGPAVSSRDLFNFLVREWYAGRRVAHDLGWEPIKSGDPSRRLNAFIFSLQAPFDLGRELKRGADFFIADRGFDPDLFVSNLQYGGSELAIPLLRAQAGKSPLILDGKGYRAFAGGVEIPFGREVTIEFQEKVIGGQRAPFALISLTNIPNERYRYVDARTGDALVMPGLPGSADLEVPQQITARCAPTLEKTFHRMLLRTACPGKPHLIKYSYYPKWRADVPIYLGSNGYMLLTPEHERTELRHEPALLDRVAGGISWAALFVLLGFGLFFARKTSTTNA